MAVNDTVDVLVPLVDLAVDEAFLIAWSGIRVHGTGVADAVFLKVFARGDQCRCEILGEEECFGILGVAEGDMAVGCEGQLCSLDSVLDIMGPVVS